MLFRPIFFLVTFVVGHSIAWSADGVVAELVWVVPEKENYQIMMSDYDGDSWREPYTVHRSENPLTSPAIGTDHQGNKTLIFSELYRPAKSHLVKITKPAGAENWSKPVLFSDYGNENLGATMVVDLSNQIWVFWSANAGDLDDIVFMQSRGASWSEPQRVHPKNDVPDHQPFAQLTTDGNIELGWKTYDFSASQYIQANHLFSLDNSEQSVYKTPLVEDQEILLEDITLPSFIPANSRAIVHFPGNVLLQSEVLINVN